jgi:hypothetical protein
MTAAIFFLIATVVRGARRRLIIGKPGPHIAKSDALAWWLGRSPPLNYRWFADSPLEGNGFENSVPRWLATAVSVGASFDGEWWPLEPSQHLGWFAEADDCSDDTATPT